MLTSQVWAAGQEIRDSLHRLLQWPTKTLYLACASDLQPRIGIAQIGLQPKVGSDMSANPTQGYWLSLRALALAIVGLPLLFDATAGAVDAPAGTSQTVFLEYQELGSRIRGWQLNITPPTEPFRKELHWGGRHICRGTINSAFHDAEGPGTSPGHTINLPFAWDYTQGKLYLDLNRNGDLTEHAACSTQPGSGDYFYETFTNIHLAFNAEAPSHPVLVDIALYAHKGKAISGGNLTWYSFWQGKAVLQGRECQVGLIEHPNHLGSTAEASLLFRAWSERGKDFSLEDGLLIGFDYCTNLFAYGQPYRLGCAYLPGDAGKYKLELTEAQAELGEVVLTGKSIQRVVLWEHQAKAPYTVVLDRPQPKVRVPVGTYNRYWVALRERATEAFSDYRDWFRPKPVTITAAGALTLPMGGPLTNWVSVAAQGRTLTFEYQLQGAGGRYRLVGPVDRSKPPEMAIYQNGKEVGSGKFEFG